MVGHFAPVVGPYLEAPEGWQTGRRRAKLDGPQEVYVGAPREANAAIVRRESNRLECVHWKLRNRFALRISVLADCR